jgi:putative flippase GtrA
MSSLPHRPQVEIVVPVHDEEAVLARSVRRLHRFLRAEFPRDDGWLFDTELLVAAQRRGLRIHEVPVDWIDDPDSRVRIVRTALEDLGGVARLMRQAPVARFACVGAASTLAYALLSALARGPLGAAGANAAALTVTAVANTAANGRLTFGVRGRAHLLRHHTRGAVVFALTLALTIAALLVVHGLDATPSRAVEAAALIAASLAATVTRYVALRTWAFAQPPSRARSSAFPCSPPLRLALWARRNSSASSESPSRSAS